MNLQQLLSLIGITSIISTIVAFAFDYVKTRLNLKYEKLFLEKENRYRSMLVFMSVVIDEENYRHIDTAYKPQEMNVKQFYLKEVVLNRNFFYLFADKAVIEAIDAFINNPTDVEYKKVAQNMRNDLWTNKSKKFF